jgi:hypothetical protein
METKLLGNGYEVFIEGLKARLHTDRLVPIIRD